MFVVAVSCLYLTTRAPVPETCCFEGVHRFLDAVGPLLLREREKKRERERGRERGGKRERQRETETERQRKRKRLKPNKQTEATMHTPKKATKYSETERRQYWLYKSALTSASADAITLPTQQRSRSHEAASSLPGLFFHVFSPTCSSQSAWRGGDRQKVSVTQAACRGRLGADDISRHGLGICRAGSFEIEETVPRRQEKPASL